MGIIVILQMELRNNNNGFFDLKNKLIAYTVADQGCARFSEFWLFFTEQVFTLSL